MLPDECADPLLGLVLGASIICLGLFCMLSNLGVITICPDSFYLLVPMVVLHL